jgi:uncharacterized protein YecT (DUF1311 family)
MLRFQIILLLAIGFAQGQTPASAPPAPPASPPPSHYDEAIFQKRIPPDQLAFLNSFAGAPAADIVRNKDFRKLMSNVLPGGMFHYGQDMPLFDALELVLKYSPVPVEIRSGRYAIITGVHGPYLGGHGFLWIDMQEGISLGGFYFHPTNGEPTPTVTIFSRQVKEDTLSLSQLPPEFAADLRHWSADAHIQSITTRYFITAANKRILLEHDEDFCLPADGNPAPPLPVCDAMNAEAADTDLTAAYYLQQVHYAPNATAWMIVGTEQVSWIRVRDDACRIGPEPLRCRIRMTRERTHFIIRRPYPTPVVRR